MDYFKIFNRFGQLVFQTDNSSDGWNGFIHGALQDAGIYVWVARGKDIYGNILSGKGNFILIR